MLRHRAFTLVELLVVISVVFIVFFIVLPVLHPPRRGHNQMSNSSKLRGQFQGMVIYAQSNAGYLPGLGTNGLPVPAGADTTGDPNSDGSVAGARYWMLLTGSFVSPQLLINPADSLAVWSTNSVTTGNHSYAMLRITTTNGDEGRRKEWKDNANGAAVMICDRNIGNGNGDAAVRSLWTTTPGDWRGSVVWGDDHVSFELSNRLTTPTSYRGITQTNDNLFATGPVAGITDNSTNSTANAMMTVTN